MLVRKENPDIAPAVDSRETPGPAKRPIAFSIASPAAKFNPNEIFMALTFCRKVFNPYLSPGSMDDMLKSAAGNRIRSC